MAYPQGRLVENFKFVTGLAPINPSSSTPDYVSMKNYDRCTVIIMIDNGAATGGAITMKQASDVAGTGEKALGFSQHWVNADISASDTLVETTTTSDTFTPTSSANVNHMYAIEIKAEDLDTANNFDCIRCGTADATAAVTAVLYILWNSRYAKATPPAAITD